MDEEPDDLSGYRVRARDGEIGHVAPHAASTAVGYLPIDTGRWILGQTVLLPATVIDRVDHAVQTVYVTCAKDEIRAAPSYRDDDAHRGELLDYYRSMPPGPAGTI